jgi:hypothetical protein
MVHQYILGYIVGTKLLKVEIPAHLCLLSTIYSSEDVESTEVSVNRWMCKENIIHIHTIVLFSYKEEWNPVICRKMDGLGGHHVKWNKSETETQVSSFLSYAET